MTLTEFLLARIAEDEAVAKAAAKYSSKWSAVDEFHETVLLHPDDTMGHTFDSAYGQIAPHIARYDPARVLAECEAKRRIVERCSDVGHGVPSTHLAQGILGLLALPYADHEDFDEAWRP